MYSIKEELDQIINLYSEKLLSLGPYTGTMEGSEPCTFFRRLTDFEGEDEAPALVRKLAQEGLNLCNSRSNLSDFMHARVRKLLPNFSDLAGEDLALDLLSSAGGINRLATLPASTIQVLGADKSFFKHIRTGSPPPKHGVLFKYAHLSTLPKRLRGKYARYVASKLAIAARADYRGTSLDTASIKDGIDERLKQIKSSSFQARPGKNTSRRESGSGRRR